MNKITLVAFLLVISLTIMAQNDYLPLIEEGKEWYYDMSFEHFDTETSLDVVDSVSHNKFFLEGDTLIDGVTWKKMYKFEEIHVNKTGYMDIHDSHTTEYNWKGFWGAVREENMRVYYRPYYDMDTILLMYMFDINPGDNMDYYNNYGPYEYGYISLPPLNSKELMNVNELERNIYSFIWETNNETEIEIWIEGIGCSIGLWPREKIEAIGPGPGHPGLIYMREHFVSCYMDDQLLATREQLTDIYNHVMASGISNVVICKTYDDSIYDLQGRRLSAEPAHGIYIKDGKKIAR